MVLGEGIERYKLLDSEETAKGGGDDDDSRSFAWWFTQEFLARFLSTSSKLHYRQRPFLCSPSTTPRLLCLAIWGARKQTDPSWEDGSSLEKEQWREQEEEKKTKMEATIAPALVQ